MLCDGTNYLHFIFTVALACCEMNRPVDDNSRVQTAGYIKAVLEVAVGSKLRESVEVSPLTYPPAGKTPLLIRISDSQPRLLWYYPNQSLEALADELAGLLGDLIPQPVSIPA